MHTYAQAANRGERKTTTAWDLSTPDWDRPLYKARHFEHGSSRGPYKHETPQGVSCLYMEFEDEDWKTGKRFQNPRVFPLFDTGFDPVFYPRRDVSDRILWMWDT